MIKCDKCKINISGERAYCPLCGKKLAALEGAEDYEVFPVIPVKKTNKIFIRTITFIGLMLMIIVELIDQVFMTEIDMGFVICFGIICAYLILMVGYKKWRNIRKVVMYEAIIGVVLTLIWDWYLGWKGWSISYVLPLVVAALNVLYFVLGLADRIHQTDYGIYFLATIGGTVIVWILLAFGVLFNVKLASITIGIGIILFLAEIIFYGQRFRAELSRRLHL